MSDKDMQQWKLAFIRELRTNSFFCTGFDHRFVHPVDSVCFWIYCGLHYPYQVKCVDGYACIVFDPVFATPILLELLKEPQEKKPATWTQETMALTAKCINELRGNKFTCDTFSHLFPTVEDAIKFWELHGLGYPYCLVKQDGGVQILFEKAFGSPILTILETNQGANKKTPANFGSPLTVLKQKLLDELRAFDPKKYTFFRFSHTFISMADAEMFGHFCQVLGPMSVVWSGNFFLECCTSAVDKVIEILNSSVPLEAGAAMSDQNWQLLQAWISTADMAGIAKICQAIKERLNSCK
jgi:hypothetical protein